GTLVDPFGMAKHLAHDLGAKAANFANCWREKQLEYSFRRALMRNYADFSVCTSDALNFTCKRFKAAISAGRQSELLHLYQFLLKDSVLLGARAFTAGEAFTAVCGAETRVENTASATSVKH